MVNDKIVYSKQAVNDIEKLKSANLVSKAKERIELVRLNPFRNPTPYEKLVGNLNGLYSRRINIKHRFVYQVLEAENTIKILSMWSHYELVR